jgi:hypothetical protein
MLIIIGKTKKVNINNLKTTKDLRIIGKEQFKAKIKEILNLYNYESMSHQW